MKKEAPAKKSRSYTMLDKVDIAGEVAYQYGFIPIVAPKIIPEDRERLKALAHDDPTIEDSFDEYLAILRIFHDENVRLPQPAMLFVKRPFAGGALRRKTGFETGGLEILGVLRPSADALLIQTVYAALAECGAKDILFEINSIGDKESFARFERELGAYIRKHISGLSGDNREEIKKDACAIFSAKSSSESEEEILRNAPRPINFLSEASRTHFKEVLEFLESMGIPYEVNDTLMPESRFASHTVFRAAGAFGKGGAPMTLALGGRLNSLARKVGYKKEVPYCSATFWYPKKIAERERTVSKFKPSQLYLVSLGAMAKLRTLPVVELLRRERIPVYHSITRENLSSQLASAEYLKVSHLLIIGQKEAIERSVVVRSTDVRAQETVTLDTLAAYLKDLLGYS